MRGPKEEGVCLVVTLSREAVLSPTDPASGPQRNARCPGVGKSTRTVHRSWIRRDSGAMESAKAIGRSVSSRVLGLDGKTSIFDHGKVRGAATTRPDPRAVPMWRGD